MVRTEIHNFIERDDLCTVQTIKMPEKNLEHKERHSLIAKHKSLEANCKQTRLSHLGNGAQNAL